MSNVFKKYVNMIDNQDSCFKLWELIRGIKASVSNEIFHVLIAHLDTSLMKMLIFRLCLLLLIRKAESAECLPKPGFGLYGDEILVEIQPSGNFDLDGCKTICDEAV